MLRSCDGDRGDVAQPRASRADVVDHERQVLEAQRAGATAGWIRTAGWLELVERHLLFADAQELTQPPTSQPKQCHLGAVYRSY